ncbi:MAG: hypothetical protein K2P81_04775 [Bacteriovoracaceae bacterium]|nr:hypothetical protein [Bacteriovoracaceae bacterium]
MSFQLNRFGLIGSHISHSKSPEIYKRLISRPHIYRLIDVNHEKDLPTEEELKKSFDGINITSPWKKHYSKYALKEFEKYDAVNCLKISKNDIIAINTDVLALKDIIPTLINKYSPKSWFVLGNGVMGQICQKILMEFNQQSAIFSRQQHGDLSHFNLSTIENSNQTKIVINACSRDFNYQGNIDATWVFWDLNYLHKQHEKYLPSRVKSYIDGLSLLESQAQYAVTFWESQQ